MSTNLPRTTWRPTDGEAEIENVGSFQLTTLSSVDLVTLSGLFLVTNESTYIEKPGTIWDLIAAPTGALQQESLAYLFTEAGDYLEDEASVRQTDDGTLPDSNWIVTDGLYDLDRVGQLDLTTLSSVELVTLSGYNLVTDTDRATLLAGTDWSEDDSR